MQFLAPIQSVIIIQLFWLSVAFIGYTLLLVLQYGFKRKILTKTENTSFAWVFLLSNALGFSYFGLVTVFGYLFSLGPQLFECSYLVAITFSVGVFFFRKLRHHAAADLNHIFRSAANVRLFSVVGLLVFTTVFYYLVNLKVGSNLGGDALVHISKIRHLATTGFTFTDAYYGSVPETRHHLSVIHTLLAIPARANITALDVWYASLGYIIFLKIITIYCFSSTLLSNLKYKKYAIAEYSALITIIASTLQLQIYAIYPTILAQFWIMLFIIGLFRLLQQSQPSILIISALLIGLSHPLLALGTIILAGMVFLLKIIFDRKSIDIHMIIYGVISVLILLVSPVISALMPNRMTEAAYNYGVGTMAIDTVKIGNNFSIMLPPDIALAIFGNSIKLVFIGGLSVLGMVALLILSKGKTAKIIIASLCMVAPMTAFNPLVYPIVANYLPNWAIYRFFSINQLMVVSVGFGLLMLAYVLWFMLSRVFHRLKYQDVALTASLLLVIFIQSYGAFSFRADRKSESNQKQAYSYISNLREVLPVGDGSIVFAEKSDGYIIPAIENLRVVAIEDAHATPAADQRDHKICYNSLMSTFSPSLLKQAKIRYILAGKNTPINNSASAQPRLFTKVKSSRSHVLYRFDSIGVDDVATSDTRCLYNEK